MRITFDMDRYKELLEKDKTRFKFSMVRFFKRVMLVFLFGLLVGLSLSHNSNTEFNSEENLISVVDSLRGGGNQKYPSNFDKNFHRILQKGFPDSKRRVEFEESQRKFYNSARSKLYRTSTVKF
jgi:hypothetical protein